MHQIYYTERGYIVWFYAPTWPYTRGFFLYEIC
jgi:hypothetical protein